MKRMELNKKVNILFAELDREKYQRKGRRRSQELERGGRYVTGKVKELKKEVLLGQRINLEVIVVGMK